MKIKSIIPALALSLASALPVNAETFYTASVSSSATFKVDVDSIEIFDDGKRRYLEKTIYNSGRQEFFISMVDCRNIRIRGLLKWDFDSKMWKDLNGRWIPANEGTVAHSLAYFVCVQPSNGY